MTRVEPPRNVPETISPLRSFSWSEAPQSKQDPRRQIRVASLTITPLLYRSSLKAGIRHWCGYFGDETKA